MWLLTAAALLVAALAGAQPSRVGCGPAAAACGPTTVAGATTTTTLPAGVAAPSWVAATIAAWMLDEAAGNIRVNAEADASWNLSEQGGTIANNTTTKMEGTASAEMIASRQLQAMAPHAQAAPFSCMLWARVGSAGSGIREVVLNAEGSSGFAIEYDATAQQYRAVFNNPTSDILPAATTSAASVWTHVALTRSGTTMALYLNGALSASKVNSFVTSLSNQFTLSLTSGAFLGEFDEGVLTGAALSAASICRICSCGIRGEQCTCAGTAFVSTGRNATACGACTLPADCSAAAPS